MSEKLDIKCELCGSAAWTYLSLPFNIRFRVVSKTHVDVFCESCQSYGTPMEIDALQKFLRKCKNESTDS